MKRFGTLFFIATLTFTGNAAASSVCNMALHTKHADSAHTPIYQSPSGLPSILFSANLDVNTDGSGRSYHPDDPRGRTLALNNIANGITRIYDKTGRDITCSPRSGSCYSLFISTFEAARDAGYNPDGYPRIETTNIIPWKSSPAGWQVPCTITHGTNEGYFVSQTAWPVDASKHICDQDRYLDSLKFNAIVLPSGAKWRSQGIVTDKADLVVVRDKDSGKIAFAINGDTGPSTIIGEGSVALASQLSGQSIGASPTYSQVKQLALANVDYLIFPTKDIRRLTTGAFSQSDIDRIGSDLFEEWGGLERLDACKTKLSSN